jgi:hypothetical protein
VVVAEVVFREVEVQVLLTTMLVNAAHPALEDREEAFRAVRMNVNKAPPTAADCGGSCGG